MEGDFHSLLPEFSGEGDFYSLLPKFPEEGDFQTFLPEVEVKSKLQNLLEGNVVYPGADPLRYVGALLGRRPSEPVFNRSA